MPRAEPRAGHVDLSSTPDSGACQTCAGRRFDTRAPLLSFVMAGDPPDDKSCRHKLTRESVMSGELRRLLERLDPSVPIVPDAEHCASVAKILAHHPDGGGDI